jgi:hypothetical protein
MNIKKGFNRIALLLSSVSAISFGVMILIEKDFDIKTYDDIVAICFVMLACFVAVYLAILGLGKVLVWIYHGFKDDEKKGA